MRHPETITSRTFGFCAAALLALPLALLAGCGAEAIQKAPPPVNPGGTPPGGGKVEDYKAGMNRVLENQRGGGGGVPPMGAPSGRPTAPPAGR